MPQPTDPGTVVHINARELQVIYPHPGPAWALTIRIKGWLRPRLTIERDLRTLAWWHNPRDDPRNETGIYDLFAHLNMYVILEQEIRDARHAAAIGPGVEGGVHTLHRGGHISDIDSRTHDRYLKELLNLKRDAHHRHGREVDELRELLVKLMGTAGMATTG